jgi:hypothetical protein
VSHGVHDKCVIVLVGKPQEKRKIGRPRRRWEDNIKTHIREIGLDVVGWTNLTQTGQWRGFVNTVMNIKGRKFPD